MGALMPDQDDPAAEVQGPDQVAGQRAGASPDPFTGPATSRGSWFVDHVCR